MRLLRCAHPARTDSAGTCNEAGSLPLSIASSAAKGGAATLGGQLVKFLVQMVAVMALSRLVSPTDFGLFAMVAALIGIATLFGDFGLSTAAIQSQTLTAQQKTNLFWTNTALGCVLSAIVFSVAGPIAGFYGSPELVEITQVLSVTFLLNSLGSQLRAEAATHLRFNALALTDVSAAVIGLGAAVVVGFMGGGYWALVTQQVGIALVTLLGLAAAARWIPGVPRRAPMRDLYTFGLNTLGVQAITYLTSNADDVLIGRVWGSTALGIYSRAYQLFRLPLLQIGAPMTKVALPILSKLQADPRYEAYVQRAQILLGYSFGGLFFVLAAVSDPTVDILLGPGWEEAKPIFAVLAIGGVFQGIGFVYYWIFLSRALTGLQLRWSIIGRSIMVALLIGGVFFGPLGVAVGSTLGQIFIWVLTTIFPMRKSGVARLPLLRIALRPIVLFTPMTAVCLIASYSFMAGWNAAGQLVVLVAFIGVYCTAGVAVIRPVREDALAIWDAVRRVRRRER